MSFKTSLAKLVFDTYKVQWPLVIVLVIAIATGLALQYQTNGSAAPGAPALYGSGGSGQVAFNNARMNDTTPAFRVSASNSGTIDRFQIELNSASDFSGTAYTETFSGSYNPGVQYTLQSTASLSLPSTNDVTYYVRVRASDTGGSTWSGWSSGTWSYTYKSAATGPEWHQTTDGQFNTGTMSTTQTYGAGSVRVTGSGASIPSNPYGRYRASTLALSDNTAVSSWTDEGTGVKNLTQATGISQPTYKATAFNGHPALEFDGTNDFLKTATYSAPLAQPNTIVMIGELITDPGPGAIPYLWDSSNGTERHVMILDHTSGNTHWTMFAGSVVAGADTPTPGQDMVLVATYNGASSDIFVNTVDSFSGSSPGTFNLDGLTFGSRYDGVASEVPANVRVSEVLVYNRALNSGERTALQDYYTETYAASSVAGSIMSTPVSYDGYTAADSWGSFSWNKTGSNGSIKTQLYYTASTTCDTLVPDIALAGNSTGFTSSPVDISALNTTTYDQLCLKASFTNNGGSPVLDDWQVSWQSANDAPSTPTTLVQAKTDDTVITTGATTDQSAVKFSASADDQDNPESLMLCVEAQPVGTAFINSETACGSGTAKANLPVTVSVQLSSLTEDANYHWQARTKDSNGSYSSWISFGSNAESATDFTVDAVPAVTPPPPPPSPSPSPSPTPSPTPATTPTPAATPSTNTTTTPSPSAASSTSPAAASAATVPPPQPTPASSSQGQTDQDTQAPTTTGQAPVTADESAKTAPWRNVAYAGTGVAVIALVAGLLARQMRKRKDTFGG